MKKILALILAAMMILAVASCGKTPEETTGGNDTTPAVTTPEDTTPEATTPEATTPEETTEGEKPETPSDKLDEIIDKIYEIKPIQIRVMTTKIDLSQEDYAKRNTGVDDLSRVAEAYLSEAMIGSQAYSMAMVRVKNAADAESVANEMLNGIDQRKWICVYADDLRVAVHGDVIMLVMIDSVYDVPADDFVDAFRTVCGGELDLVLKK